VSEVLATIAQETAEGLGITDLLILIPDETGQRLELGAASRGTHEEISRRVTKRAIEAFTLPLTERENAIVKAYHTGETQRVSAEEPYLLTRGVRPGVSDRAAKLIARLMGVRETLCVPLPFGDRVVGVMVAFAVAAATQEQLELLSAIADQAGLALENARLYEETQRSLEQVTALREIDKAISSILDLRQVLDIILEQLERVMPYHSAAVFLLTDNTAKVAAARGFPNLEEVMQVSFSVKDDALAKELLEEKQPLVLTDAQADDRFQARGGTEYVRSWIGVPLIAKEKVMGFLTIDHGEPGVYSEESADTALAFASQVAIAIENAQAYEMVRTQNLETIAALATAVEARDPYTSGHSQDVTQLATATAQEMGLSAAEIENLRMAGLLHDIGKIGVPDSVLNKPSRLTSAERIMINSHPIISAEIVGKIEALAHLVPIIRHHHERWDGTGYPDGRKGEDIPLLARILAVADGFEAMTSERPYRAPMSTQEALAELQEGAGKQWDPTIVKVFCSILKRGRIPQARERR